MLTTSVNSASNDSFLASQSQGFILVDIDQLSAIISRAQATIRTQVTREPHKLPARFNDGTNAVRWLLKDVWEWLESRSNPTAQGFQHVPVSAAPAKNEVTKRRGRPTKAEIDAARKDGITVSELRSQGVK